MGDTQSKVKENLTEGLLVANYREMCNLLDEDIRGGKSKQYQIKEWNRFFSYIKQGNEFVINQIFDTPLEKIDKRAVGGNKGKYKEADDIFLIPKELSRLCGVYIIKLNKNIYIGSTINGFRRRYYQHLINYNNIMPHTQQLLKDGATFDYLWISENNETEIEVRKKEQYYIEKYRVDDYNLINKDNAYAHPIIKTRKNISVLAFQYDIALEILRENNIQC